jgi:hypothetical protein
LARKVHSDGFNTACPDPILRSWVHAGMPITNIATPTREWDTVATQAEIQAALKALIVSDTEVQAVLARLPWTNTVGRSTTTRAAQLEVVQAGIAALLARDPATIDAATLVDMLPDTLAVQVADLIAARMAS